MNKYGKAAIGAAGALMLLGGSAVAQERSITLTSGFPPGSIPHEAHQALADWAADNTDIRISVSAMTLLSLPETVPGVRDGMADMGYVLTQYHPAEFANSNLVTDMSMLTNVGTPTEAPGVAMSAAFAEYILLHCPQCLQEFANENQLFLGSGASSAYALMCTREIETLADLPGKRFRVPGGNFARWVEHFGGIRVTLPAAEMYEALSQGVVDCSTISTPEMTNWQLYDVVTHMVTGVPGGVYVGVGSNNINIDTWRSLTDEQRGHLLWGSAFLTASVAVGYHNAAIEAEERAEEEGINISPAGEELRAASDEFVFDDMATIAEEFSSIYGLGNVDERMDVFVDLVERWKGLMDGVDTTNVDAVTEVLWEEIYSRVDPSAYGMN